MIIIEDEELKEIFGTKMYGRGLDMYYRNKIRTLDIKDNQDDLNINAIVESAFDLDEYEVKIILKKTIRKVYASCTCKSFEQYGKCKHIAAVFIKINKDTSVHGSERLHKLMIGEDVISKYKKNINEDYIYRQKIDMEIELEINNMYSRAYSIEIKVGKDKLYVVKNMKTFIEHVFFNQEPLIFGKNYEFVRKDSYFEDKHYKILQILREIYEADSQVGEILYQNRAIFLSGKKAYLTYSQFLKVLRIMEGNSINITVQGLKYEKCQVLCEDMPLDFSLDLKEESVDLCLKDNMPVVVDNKNKIFIYNSKIYLPSDVQINAIMPIYNELSRGKERIVSFEKSDLQDIITYVIPKLKSVCHSFNEDESIKKMLRQEPLTKEFYLDKYNDGIRCEVIFKYGDVSIDVNGKVIAGDNDNDNGSVIVRDTKGEKQVIKAIQRYGFFMENEEYILRDEDSIVVFITNGIDELRKEGTVYYSEEFKKIRVIPTRSFVSNITINDEDLLEFSFKVEGIEKEELRDVFDSLKHKKKYHKLKDGSLIPLYTDEVKELNNVIKNFDIDINKLSKDKVILPKYASLYLDEKINNSGLRFVEKDNKFKELISTVRNISKAEYEIPKLINGTLREYQKTGFKWFKTLSQCEFGGILGDEMGLGKTLQAICYIASEVEEGKLKDRPAIIVCPTSLVYNWQAEIEKFAPHIRVLTIEGNKSQRDKIIEDVKNYDVIITSYPLLRRDINDYEDIKFGICIIDEAQYIKNPTSLNAESVKAINSAKRFALTGTPIENSLTELWSIFDFIMPGYLKTQGRFNKDFQVPIIKAKDQEVLRELLKLIKPFILRRFKKDVIKELPPKIEHKVIVDMTDDQKKVYAAYVKNYKEQIENEIANNSLNRNKIKILALLTRLRQICCDPSTFIENYNGDSGKIQALEDIVQETLDNGHKILLFSQFTTVLGHIRQRLTALGIDTMYLDGSVPAQQRMQMVNEFNEGETKVFLISLKAGGTGLNLIGADVVIHFDPWWNPAVEDQAVDRAHRIGQKKTVEVIKLITRGTIEEKIYKLQEKKKEIIGSVLDKDAQDDITLTSMTEEEIKDLFN